MDMDESSDLADRVTEIAHKDFEVLAKLLEEMAKAIMRSNGVRI